MPTLTTSLHCVFDDLRVNAGHSVHGVGPDDAQVSHVDFLDGALLDQGHSAETVKVSGEELADALKNIKGRRLKNSITMIDFFFLNRKTNFHTNSCRPSLRS